MQQHQTLGAAQGVPVNTILQGDVRQRLRELPDNSIDCIITSPPYFGVRNYGHSDQMGAEKYVEHWAEELRNVCRQLARVLKPTGALWLNLGDCYARHQKEGAPHKSLLLGPSRLALALLRDGWIIRNQVVWAKANPMPSSVRDRLTTTHEAVYFLVRSRRYFFDIDAIRQPLRTTTVQSTSDAERTYPPDDSRRTARGVNKNDGLGQLKARGVAGHPLGKNPGDVWHLATANFRGAHFAVFPFGLTTIPLLATCPEKVCVECGRPWQRRPATRETATLGELRAECACHAGTRPGVVLDPFMGAGTVALAAEQHGRDWLGIELNADYVALAEDRLAAWRQLKTNHDKENTTWNDHQ
jgi:site-specific DNA-methyltransferase (adenine-specific)